MRLRTVVTTICDYILDKSILIHKGKHFLYYPLNYLIVHCTYYIEFIDFWKDRTTNVCSASNENVTRRFLGVRYVYVR